MAFIPRSFRAMFLENLYDINSWRALVIPLAVFFPIAVNYPDSFLKIIWSLIVSPKAWLIYFLLFVLDAFVRAIYWYARERNPRYIRKMEAYEKIKEAKEAVKSKETPP